MTTVSTLYGMAPPKPFKYKETAVTTNPELIVGIEIETERCRLSADTYIGLFHRPLGIETKTDGSLRNVDGLRAYEFITRPTQLQNVVPIMAKFYEQGQFTEENYTDRCSIHVHVNCTDMEWEQVANVALIYTVVEEMLFEFVNERPGHRDGWSRDTNIYCVPWNQCRNHLNLVNQFISNPNEALARWQKYTALNLLPLSTFGTVEFRHMHGTADMTKLTKWLNIIGAIFKYAKGTSLEGLSEEINGLNTSSNYEQFFRAVTGNQLPFNDVYRMRMEEGTILAKYSMMSWRNNKGKAKPEAADIMNAMFTPAPQAVPQEGVWGNPVAAPPDNGFYNGFMANVPAPGRMEVQPRLDRQGRRPPTARPGLALLTEDALMMAQQQQFQQVGEHAVRTARIQAHLDEAARHGLERQVEDNQF